MVDGPYLCANVRDRQCFHLTSSNRYGPLSEAVRLTEDEFLIRC
jgi:hypothetical protein